MAAVLGLQFTLDVHAHEALGEVGDGQLRRGRRGHRVLAALDAVDDDGGCFLASSVASSPWCPRVTRFSPTGPLDCTT